MARIHRPVIAINEKTGERRCFASQYEAGRALGATQSHIATSLLTNSTARGWRLYDTPEKIRERIAELEEQIKFLEG